MANTEQNPLRRVRSAMRACGIGPCVGEALEARASLADRIKHIGRATGGFEGFVLQQMLGHARTHLKIPLHRKRHPKGRPSELPVNIPCEGNPEGIWKNVPVDDHPFILRLFRFAPPRILTGESFVDLFAIVPPPWSLVKADSESKLRDIGDSARIMELFNPRYFCLMLGKIGHSLAYATYKDQFTPIIGDIIRNADVAIANYVGGSLGELPSEGLHNLEIGWKRTPSRGDYLTARVKLFASLGAPTYEVVVGHRDSLPVEQYSLHARDIE